MSIERFGVSMDSGLLERFDRKTRDAGYGARSEAIRDIVRDYLVRQEWRTGEGTVVGTLTLVYDHHARELQSRLTEQQHDHQDVVLCTTHVHLDHHNCLEVIVLRGAAGEVRQLANSLISLKGVKHGELVCTATVSDI